VAVQVASELGTWPLASVWPLGVNEKKAGTLLVRTIVTNFGFPAFIWQDEATGQTNFNFGDRLRFFLFRLKNSKGPQTTIDLTETTFLKKTRLVGGEWGWRISGEMPSSLSALFPDETVLQSGPKVKIINYSGKVGLGESIGAVMETIGIKVAAIQKEEARDFDCAISGNDTRLVKRLNLVFECRDKAVEPLQAGFAVSLEIGRDFSRRF